jgi:hypothetical protein
MIALIIQFMEFKAAFSFFTAKIQAITNVNSIKWVHEFAVLER